MNIQYLLAELKFGLQRESDAAERRHQEVMAAIKVRPRNHCSIVSIPDIVRVVAATLLIWSAVRGDISLEQLAGLLK